MRIEQLFEDYAAYHRTGGNKLLHRFGIPMIMLALLGMLARVTVVRATAFPVDAAMILIVAATLFYLKLEWRLALAMLAVSIAMYAAGAALPFRMNAVLFVAGWVLQFAGHSIFEKRQPAFVRNLVHLLVGPLWILNDLIPVVKHA